ncbi:MAG: TolC family protein [Bdellovibrionales bacterium]|nr:TolC family protein [Bdellovibrionales bacterium]
MRLSTIVGLIGIVGSPGAFATELTLSDYLNQVRGGNGSYAAAEKLSEAAQKLSLEAGLLTKPNFFANFQSQDDKRPPQMVFQATRTANKTIQAGFESQFRFGLSGKLYYQLSDVTMEGMNPTFLTRGTHFFLASPVLELNQSLWRNGFGSELTAQQTALETQQLASHFRESFTKTMKVAEAESAYWRMASAREVVRIQKSLVERAQKMVDWATRRERLNLGDRADRLQVDALLLSRKVDLELAEDELRDAGYNFNMQRGRDGSDVPEGLAIPKNAELLAWKAPERKDAREDLKALEKQSEALVASATVNAEKNRPQLDVFGNFSLNALEATSSEAIGNSTNGDRPMITVGLRFKTPLALGTTSQVADGRNQERVAAEVSYRQKKFEQEQDYKNMTLKLEEAKARLKMTEDLVALQESKLTYERDRLMRGRTTTFQVLQFEADFGAAELARVRSASAVLNLTTQLKTYGGAQ